MQCFTAAESDAGLRLDHFLSARMPEYSRSRLQSWIDEARVRVNGEAKKASWKLRSGEVIEVDPAELKPLNAYPEDIPLEILYEDADVVAINKPAGLVVHAGAGCTSGTLVNALLHHMGKLSTVGGDVRPGIVHRLDKGTSGVLLAARTDSAHRHLAAQFASREVHKIYLALVQGEVRNEAGSIRRPIMRHPLHRTRMTSHPDHVENGKGRDAYTEYRVLQRFHGYTLLEVRIGTGRTHQIRVHLSQLGYPVAGDTLYGAAARPAGLPALGRPWLHAWRITFRSPSKGEPITLEAPLPPELTEWQSRLQAT